MIPVARECNDTDINSVGIRKVSATPEMGKYVFCKNVEWSENLGKTVGSIKTGGNISRAGEREVGSKSRQKREI